MSSPKIYTDHKGNQWKHGDVREDGKIFRTLVRGKYAVFISPEAYARLIHGNTKRSATKTAEKKISDRKRTVRKSMVSDRIKREILELHARGKDIVTISFRLYIPASSVREVIENSTSEAR